MSTLEGRMGPVVKHQQRVAGAPRRSWRRGTRTVYRCPYPGCKNTSDRRYNIKVHMRIHTGEMPYVCKVGCGKAFKWKSSCDNHERKYHSDEIGDASETAQTDMTLEEPGIEMYNEPLVEVYEDRIDVPVMPRANAAPNTAIRRQSGEAPRTNTARTVSPSWHPPRTSPLERPIIEAGELDNEIRVDDLYEASHQSLLSLDFGSVEDFSSISNLHLHLRMPEAAMPTDFEDVSSQNLERWIVPNL